MSDDKPDLFNSLADTLSVLSGACVAGAVVAIVYVILNP